MAENVPRRLKRFSREEEKESFQQQEITDVSPPEENQPVFPETAKKLEKKTSFLNGIFGAKKNETAKKQEKETIPKNQKFQEKGNAKDVLDSLFAQLQEQKKKETKKESINLAMDHVKKFKEEHNRFPSGEEYDEIAENIYQQIKQQEDREETQRKTEGMSQKTAGREKRFEKTKETTTQSEQKAIVEEQLKGMDLQKIDVKNIFEEQEDKEFRLEDMKGESGDEMQLEGLDDSIDSLSKTMETEKNNCPNCKAESSEIIFCPGCGAAFCTHCAKTANIEAGIIKFTCPKCNKEVKAQK